MKKSTPIEGLRLIFCKEVCRQGLNLLRQDAVPEFHAPAGSGF
jgi:hypothetical protein